MPNALLQAAGQLRKERITAEAADRKDGQIIFNMFAQLSSSSRAGDQRLYTLLHNKLISPEGGRMRSLIAPFMNVTPNEVVELFPKPLKNVVNFQGNKEITTNVATGAINVRTIRTSAEKRFTEDAVYKKDPITAERAIAIASSIDPKFKKRMEDSQVEGQSYLQQAQRVASDLDISIDILSDKRKALNRELAPKQAIFGRFLSEFAEEGVSMGDLIGMFGEKHPGVQREIKSLKNQLTEKEKLSSNLGIVRENATRGADRWVRTLRQSAASKVKGQTNIDWNFFEDASGNTDVFNLKTGESRNSILNLEWLSSPVTRAQNQALDAVGQGSPLEKASSGEAPRAMLNEQTTTRDAFETPAPFKPGTDSLLRRFRSLQALGGDASDRELAQSASDFLSSRREGVRQSPLGVTSALDIFSSAAGGGKLPEVREAEGILGGFNRLNPQKAIDVRPDPFEFFGPKTLIEGTPKLFQRAPSAFGGDFIGGA